MGWVPINDVEWGLEHDMTDVRSSSLRFQRLDGWMAVCILISCGILMREDVEAVNDKQLNVGHGVLS